MDTPLTEEQQQLLSAWLDGEVADAEKQTVDELLTREDAQQYFESLRATAALVAAHGPVRAPVGLSGRVLGELEKDFKPKAMGPGSEPFESIPTVSWRTPLYAVAAAVIVSLGIMFGPSLFGPGEPTPAGVARTALDNLESEPAVGGLPVDGVAEDEYVSEEHLGKELDSLKELAENSSTTGGRDDMNKFADDVERANEAMRRTQNNTEQADPEGNWGGGSGAGPGKDARRVADKENSKETPERAKLEEDERQGESTPSEDPADRPSGDVTPDAAAEKKPGNSTLDESKAGKDYGHSDGGKAGSAPTTKGTRSETKLKKDEQTRESGGELDDETDADRKGRNRGLGGGTEPEPEPSKKRADPDAPAQPAPPLPPEAEEAQDGNDAETPKSNDAGGQVEGLTIDITEADTLAAQTDVLWVSNLYGDASVSEESKPDDEVESITVEVDADKLPELMAALRRLAKDQGYGEVEGEASAGDADTDEAGASERRISGYLPAGDGREPSLANPAEPGTPKPQSRERVKLVIRLH